MKKLVFCCLLIFALMACGERNTIMGRWAVQIEDSSESFITMADDSIVTPELRFSHDTVHMVIKSDNNVVSSECVAKYFVDGDQMRVINPYGKEQLCKYTIKDDEMTVVDRDDPNKVIMRLRRIKEG